MIEFFREMLSSDTALSSVRWVLVWTYLFCICVPISAWTYVYIFQNAQADIPANVVMIVGWVITAISGTKVAEKFAEKKDAPKP